MPTQERLADFIATVVRNEHVEAIERFYAPHATMQENNAPPRAGVTSWWRTRRPLWRGFPGWRPSRPAT